MKCRQEIASNGGKEIDSPEEINDSTDGDRCGAKASVARSGDRPQREGDRPLREARTQRDAPLLPRSGERSHGERSHGERSHEADQQAEVPSWAFVERPPIEVDGWRWDEDLLEAERVIKTYGQAREVRSSESGDRRHLTATGPVGTAPHRIKTKCTKRVRSPRFAFVSWALLSLGVMALVFGGVLLGWSFWTGQQQFWTLGLPFTIAGQAGLILGLVLQLDGLWQSNQDATVVLTDLDEQIDELRQATSLLSTTHSSHAQSFYFHLAEGASPHMLLSDLKGQLDLLAMRMSKDGSQ